jgi:hypothetical protein
MPRQLFKAQRWPSDNVILGSFTRQNFVLGKLSQLVTPALAEKLLDFILRYSVLLCPSKI